MLDQHDLRCQLWSQQCKLQVTCVCQLGSIYYKLIDVLHDTTIIYIYTMCLIAGLIQAQL